MVMDLGVNRKRICNFPLLNNSNYGCISYRFRDIDAFSSKIAFSTPPLLDAPSEGIPCNINVIYTPLQSTFDGLQFHRWHLQVYLHLHSFSRCWLPKSRNHVKCPQNLTLQWFKVIQVIDLGVNQKRICDFLLITNSNFRRISYCFRDIDA